MSFVDKVRTQKLLSFTLMVFTLSVGVILGTLIGRGVDAARDQQAPGATPLVIPNPVELSNAFTQIAKQVEPSVVNVSVAYDARPARKGSRRQAQPDDGTGGDGMDELFRFFSPFGGGESPDSRGGTGLGSGVVVDPAGYILTNNHVVDKASRIRVKFFGDVNQYDAKVVGTDQATDLAVIRVEGRTALVAAKIGNSDAVQVGDWSMAIGSPFGFDATVTAGIISAKERSMQDDPSMQFQHFLQTDAAINPGNSGGPLLNMRGEVIGINTAIASRSGGYQGIGFAMPINTAAAVYNEIIKTGHVTRGSIGIRFPISDQPDTVAMLKSVGADGGVYISEVTPGGPAQKAGLKVRDVIVAVNGKPVRVGDDLVNMVTVTPIGDSVNLTVLRDGKRDSYKVVVGNMSQVFPNDFGAGGQPEQAKPEGTSVSFGMTIVPLTERQREAMKLKDKVGVRVAEVEPNSFAEDVKLFPGDVIVAIGYASGGRPLIQPIASIEDMKKVQSLLKVGDSVRFDIMRRASPRATDWEERSLAGTLTAALR